MRLGNYNNLGLCDVCAFYFMAEVNTEEEEREERQRIPRFFDQTRNYIILCLPTVYIYIYICV